VPRTYAALPVLDPDAIGAGDVAALTTLFASA